MPLNPSKGNMYPFVTHTWNTVKGKCPHDCSYCYMKRFPQREIHFDKKELNTDLGRDNFIFVGSSCDMWARNITSKWIYQTIDYCTSFDKNKYLFQSKDPSNMFKFLHGMPSDIIIATTVESNKYHPGIMNMAPEPHKRIEGLFRISCEDIPVMITVEPIIDFDLSQMVRYLLYPNPKQINIGADSQGHNLPEPPKEKILELIEALKGFTEVKIKKNLNRILK